MAESGFQAHGVSLREDQVALLRQIQQCARESAALLAIMYESGGDAHTATDLVTKINALDRERDLTQIQARAAGVPPEWIERVRVLGERGYPWRADQPLPVPAERRQRQSVRRVAGDIERLKDIAAVHAARRLATAPVPPDEREVTQLRRAMHAVWMRAGRTAHAIEMTASEREKLWSTTPQEWRRRIEHYLDSADPEDLTTKWNRYTGPEIATEARRSLARLRRDGDHGPDVPLPDMPPTPSQMLAEAMSAAQPELDSAGNPIDTAVDAALDSRTVGTWPGDTAATETADRSVRDLDRSGGPDP